jgi:CubicO group peptidase (beta-lactamase class C family)
VRRKVVQWADPVVSHLPDFALSVPYATENVSYGDLFSHRSGLPDHAGDLLEDLGYDQQYVLHALRLLRLDPFRATYAYTNFGLTAAAVSAAAAAGMNWASAADAILFGPLGMSATSYRYSDFLAQTDRAAMHVRINGRWYQKYARDADPEAPAGGASSNVLQMADVLYVSRNTVKTRPRSIYQKLEVESRSQAIGRAVELRLL